MADTKLVICEKCLGTGHVNGGNENSTWSKTCENCHGIGFSRVPMTNADRIRAMSDEELVVFLDGFSGRCLDCVEDAKNQSCPIYKEGHYCRPQDIMEWLQQPAEGE